jgi:hypothetical protein
MASGSWEIYRLKVDLHGCPGADRDLDSAITKITAMPKMAAEAIRKALYFFISRNLPIQCDQSSQSL